MNPLRTLITGGARCGKSGLALQIALSYPVRVFIATAEITDPEMGERISTHRLERGDLFHTVEEPVELGAALQNLTAGTAVAVVDCLTVWLGNLYHHLSADEGAIRERIDGFLRQMDRVPQDLIFVTNEVGWGIVPENGISRSYRDMAGYLNRMVAERATHVYLVCAGIPLALKGPKSSAETPKSE